MDAADVHMSADDRLGIDLARSENHLIRQLIEVRRYRGLRPADLARKMDVDRSVVTRFEAGGTNPTMATINRYAEAVSAMIRYTVEPSTQASTRLRSYVIPFEAREASFNPAFAGNRGGVAEGELADLVSFVYVR